MNKQDALQDIDILAVKLYAEKNGCKFWLSEDKKACRAYRGREYVGFLSGHGDDSSIDSTVDEITDLVDIHLVLMESRTREEEDLDKHKTRGNWL